MVGFVALCHLQQIYVLFFIESFRCNYIFAVWQVFCRFDTMADSTLGEV